jgi:hypothetical protein
MTREIITRSGSNENFNNVRHDNVDKNTFEMSFVLAVDDCTMKLKKRAHRQSGQSVLGLSSNNLAE